MLRADQCVSEQISRSVLLCFHLIYLCRLRGRTMMPPGKQLTQSASQKCPGVHFQAISSTQCSTALRINPDPWDEGQASEDPLLVLYVVLSKEMDERDLLFLDTLPKEPPAGDCISQYTYWVAQHYLRNRDLQEYRFKTKSTSTYPLDYQLNAQCVQKIFCLAKERPVSEMPEINHQLFHSSCTNLNKLA